MARDAIDARADRLREHDLVAQTSELGRRDDARRGGRCGGDLDEQRARAAAHAVGHGAVVDMLRRRPRVERHRGAPQLLGAEGSDEGAGRDDHGVARLHGLTPDRGQQVGLGAQRGRALCGGALDEVREIARLLARKEEAGAAHEEDLRPADPHGVQLVVHDHDAGQVEGERAASVAE